MQGAALLLSVVLAACSFCRAADHDTTTLCTSDVCFTLHMDRVNFEDARKNCHHNGGYLVTIRDREEEAAFQSILSRIDRRHQENVLEFWIGLKLHKGDCVLPERSLRGFKWVSTNGDSKYSNWKTEPVGTCAEERCVMIHYTSSGRGNLKWVASPCKAPTFYACKFYFQGMCKPLPLLGPGKISYTPPFSEQPLNSVLKALPLGTIADIWCSDNQSDYSLCKSLDDAYGWTVPGPFCASGEPNCDFNNGGCEHLCVEDAGGARCVCKEGYELDQDAFSCRPKDYCGDGTCEYQCVTGESGYSCVCPQGFRLDTNQHNCSDIDECRTQACEEHSCVNTHGGYTCKCERGYEMVGGKCRDVDECSESRCAHSCLNSLGSFSCHCHLGFALAADGYSCDDVDECLTSRCEFTCVNAPGSFLCVCPKNFGADDNGTTCAPLSTDASTAAPSTEPVDRIARGKVAPEAQTPAEPQNRSLYTDAPAAEGVSTQREGLRGNSSAGASRPMEIDEPLNARLLLLLCVTGSAVSSLLLVAAAFAVVIIRRKRSRREATKTATADGYCWVSSGLEPHLEKLYNSILTDDL
ncbi:complement component C1q receptor [Lampris incognitus]|uniref:complement component C1q receptor n=1 Tax=Lampris incognitus TaxID=2546036 RepID=UPI0024B4C9FD|nr:complement component C1q receptor [Lampris incognitus]